MQADVPQYFGHVRHYYGCPENDPCDHYELDKPLSWGKKLLICMEHIEEAADKYARIAFTNYYDWSMTRLVTRRFGPLIRNRWLKKSTLQCKSILLKALPNLHRRKSCRLYHLRLRHTCLIC